MNDKPFFLIFSLSRCGSTSLYRALNTSRQCNLIYEPDFSTIEKEDIGEQYKRLRESCDGIKHVWDPSGFPFRTAHQSNIQDIQKNIEQWLQCNESILGIENQKIIFLTREDEATRIVSDLMGQATDIWGPASGAKSTEKVALNFRDNMKAMSSISIPVDVAKWYVDNVSIWNRRLRKATGKNQVMDLAYEEMFGVDLTTFDRLRKLVTVLDFFELDSSPIKYNYWKASKILSPRGKLNSLQTYSQIANHEELSNTINWHPAE